MSSTWEDTTGVFGYVPWECVEWEVRGEPLPLEFRIIDGSARRIIPMGISHDSPRIAAKLWTYFSVTPKFPCNGYYVGSRP